MAAGRVLIAFNATAPLDPSPTWTRVDDPTGSTFPYDFVAGYDTTSGRQTLISQTNTGTATVYLNDRAGLFDPRNSGSPYFGKIVGSQIQLQLYNPVDATWYPQWRGHIDDINYDIDGSAVNSSGDPINASIQLDCVDIFDFLEGYGLTPGLDGITPRTVPSGTAGGAVPAGKEDQVYYAATSGSVDDRIIEILADVGINPSMYVVASGNVKVVATQYTPDESALTALRDAADAELPFIANCYVDHKGRFVFRGRYSRFNATAVAAEVGSDWDFATWKVGDGKSVLADSPNRAPMRVLTYTAARSNLLNAAICYPQGIAAADMPNQVYADTTSITDYGKHAASPMSDLITGTPETSGFANNKVECAKYAELLVKNQKDPRVAITALQLKSVDTRHQAASANWAILTQSDVSHLVNVKAGYPGGTGLTGAATVDDYFIEGRQLTVRPANTSYDYVELDLEVSPAVWSMDTHGVFPAFPGV